jgi:uncharacterized protein YcfL
MKKILTLVVLIIALAACSSDSYVNRNPYLNTGSFSCTIDMTLPSNNGLLYTANPVVIRTAGTVLTAL